MSGIANPIETGRPSIPRYTDRALPPYRHQPGLTPHPEKDPQGHMAGRAPWPERLEASAEAPASRELFLYGVDLFNHGYWWEAHAAWERLWKAAPAGEGASIFLQGLIQLSAALLKWRAGAEPGARRLGDKGLAKLRREESRGYFGVDVGRFVAEMAEFLEGGGTPPLLRVE